MADKLLPVCENSLDQSHIGILHGGGGGERSDIWGTEMPKLTWETMELGIKATAYLPGMGYTRASYHILPSMNRLPQPWPGKRFKWPRYSAMLRTPVDDHHRLVFGVCFTPEIDGKMPDLHDGMAFHLYDELMVHREQDYQAIVTQGKVFDRSTEQLSTSDEGVILLRKLVMEGIEAAADGRDLQGIRWTNDGDDVIDLEGIVMDDLDRTDAA